MKRKELMKRALALTLSAAMTVGNMPAVTYASEVVVTEDGGASQADEQLTIEEDGVTDEEEPDSGEVVEMEAGDQEEVPVEIDNSVDEEPEASVEVQTADQGIQVMTVDDDVKAAAAAYLKENYIDKNKIISNGGTSVVKSDDGLSYRVPLKMSSGSSISSMRLKTESSSSSYKSGWYINSEWVNVGSKKPSSIGSPGITRPTADQGDQTITATLRLFSSDTEADVINDETQAAKAALATQDFNITIEAAEPNYTMTIKVVDEEGNVINDATVTLEKNWSTVYPKDDGSYDMEKGAYYGLTVKKDGYNDYKESNFTFIPTEINTVKTVTLVKKVEKNVQFNVTDKATGKKIDNPTVSVKQGWYTTIKPETDGSYKLVAGTTYNYTVEAKNYTKVSGSFTPNKDTTTFDVEMEKNITEYAVSIKPVEKDGTTEVKGATVTVTYEEEDYWGETETVTLKPNADGSYPMDKNTTYTYTVTAEGYKEATGTYKPEGTEEEITFPVIMQKDSVVFDECKVTVQPVDKDSKEAITGTTITVTFEGYDDYYQNPFTDTLKANEDGTYTMKKGVEYTCTVTAEGYKDGTATYTPDGQKDNDIISVSLEKKPVDTKDQQIVDAIKAQFDKELTLRPNFAKDKNILDVVMAKINGYTGIETDGVKVTIKSSGNEDIISKDGKISYNTSDTMNSNGLNFTNVGVVYLIEKNGAKAETKESTATIGWDRDHFNSKMKAESDTLTWNTIKDSNEFQTEVTNDLTLPQIMTSSAKTAWSKITWTSSDPNVISIDATGYDSIIDPKKGTIHAQTEDTEVTLTATFQANDNTLNSYVEKATDFATYTKEFKVTVKGNKKPAPTEAELKAILDKYYTEDRITEFENKDQIADLKNCTTDLQLPRYTRIQDDNGQYVFANKEIVVTSSNTDVITVNGYRAAVDRFAANEDVTVNLIVTFTREGVTAVKEIPVTVKPITEAEVQDELKMMEAAKEHYFDGLNDGQYADKDSITGNLHPFQEMIFDENGAVKWIYDNADRTGKGIIADNMFEDSGEMEGAGYNKFKSSNNAIVAHENLVVVRPESDTQITISSVLSSERYGEAAKAHPDNVVLQKLYKQPVSVTVTVKGNKPAKANLETIKTKLEELYNSITEGTEPGQYPEGTKDKLQAAIKEAEELLAKADATDDDYQKKVTELTSLLNAVQDSQNEESATVTAKFNQDVNADIDVSQLTVTSHVAAQYGYQKPEAFRNKVTVLDVIVAWHAAKYGQAFKADPTKYLVMSRNFIGKIYGKTTSSVSLMVNNKFPGEDGSATAPEAVVKTGDVVTLFEYGDTAGYMDLYLYFEGIPATVDAKESISLTLYGYRPGNWEHPETPSVRPGYTVAATDAEGNRVATAVTDEKGQAVLKIGKAGTYDITVVEVPKDSQESAYVIPKDIVEVTGTTEEPVEEHVHSFGEWRTVSEATVFTAEKQERVCACGEKETRTVGSPLKATIKVNMSTIPLKVKQTTTKFKVTGLAKGDAVASYASSNKKIFTVDKNGKLKAGKKKGSAKLIITLKSGLKKEVTVKVQKSTVKTTKILGLQKEITLKKGQRISLKPVLQPLTSQQKLRYSSSKKSVAAISSRGSIKAKKVGKTTITVKSGSKKVRIKVNVVK